MSVDSSPPRCPVCASERIPGVGSCANCGEAFPKAPWVASFDVHDDPLPDYYTPPSTDTATIYRALMEARALEYAGDVVGATAIYERVCKTRTRDGMAYKRLAVIYRRGKQPAHEERVVRLALAHIPSGPTSWFVVRLAKILGEQKKPHR